MYSKYVKREKHSLQARESVWGFFIITDIQIYMCLLILDVAHHSLHRHRAYSLLLQTVNSEPTLPHSSASTDP